MISHTTRIAPSPTGLLHLGTARTALFNWLVARSTGGRFILRIDDTDGSRNLPGAVQVIDDAMAWLGLDHDERFHQSDRLESYRVLANTLVNKGYAINDGAAVRLKTPKDMPDSWSDTIKGRIRVTENDLKAIDGLVLLRSDGMPTYHFASVVDDMNCEVTWVIRGVDHISNTAKQIAIACVLNELLTRDEWPMEVDPFIPPRFSPLWSHVGLLTEDGKKLSKRDGAASVLSYRDERIDPDAMFNWLLRLGWGPSVDDKSAAMISRERALELFLNGGGMRAAASGLNKPLLAALDRKYKARKEGKKERVTVRVCSQVV